MQRVGDCPVVIARELTKIHEELVRGPISDVLKRLPTPRGEFTVVAEIGHITDIKSLEPSVDGHSKRATIAALAKSYGVSTNQVYQALEALRDSGN
jgi:16S rRNA (cytidine1402-2'-O)-methyltransferase